MGLSHLERGLHNVPAELTSFVGRRRELGDIKRLLASYRLLTLTGPGGVGKTRLALRAAAQTQRAFADGVWLVELASLDDPALVTQALFAALGLRDQSARWPVATLCDYLAEKQLLLLLDNCEHLLDACAVLADAVLRACANLRILATSRQALGLLGEATLTVPSLSVGDEAVTLFAERGAAVAPGFQLTQANHPTVVAVCRELDGIPLAIELAAARLKALTVEQILERLNDRFLLLSTGNRVATPRHRTLKATMEWSFGLLTDAERTVWRRLSVFADGFDLDAAEIVAAGDGLDKSAVFDVLTSILDKSILMRLEAHDRTRYQMLESIRAFGTERLRASGEEAAVRRRHRDWIAGLARSAEREWRGSHQAYWLARLEAERGNLRAALDYCLTWPDEANAGLDIAGGLWLYWEVRGLSEGRRWLAALLERQPRPTAARAKALAAAGLLAISADRADAIAGRSFLEECLALARDLGQVETAAFALRYLSGAALLTGDLATSLVLAQEARDLYESIGDPGGAADATLALALTTSMQGRREDAIGHYEACIALAEKVGEQWVCSFALWALAIELLRQHRHREAADLQKQSLKRKRALDDRVGIALNVEVLAWIAAAEGRAERAALLLGAVKTLWESIPATLFELWKRDHEECEASTRPRLGDAFENAYRRGRFMRPEETIPFALEETREKGASSTRQRVTGHGLTRRETTVAGLVAEGLTNKQIAYRLVVSERTVDTHVLNILNKLGFNSRSQIATWATERSATKDKGFLRSRHQEQKSVRL